MQLANVEICERTKDSRGLDNALAILKRDNLAVYKTVSFRSASLPQTTVTRNRPYAGAAKLRRFTKEQAGANAEKGGIRCSACLKSKRNVRVGFTTNA